MGGRAVSLLRALFCSCLFVLLASPVASQPTLHLSDDRIFVDGLTEGGDVVLFGAAREGLGYFVRLRLTRELLAADAQGRAELSLGRELADRSVWAVIDLTDGEYSLAAPTAEGPREDPFDVNAFQSGSSGELDQVQFSSRVSEVLVARPGRDEQPRGVWSLRLADGDPATDADGAFDQRVTLDVVTLQPLLGEAAPEQLLPGDVVVMINPDTLEISAARLEEAGGTGGER